jgi:hypothetical protein
MQKGNTYANAEADAKADVEKDQDFVTCNPSTSS